MKAELHEPPEGGLISVNIRGHWVDFDKLITWCYAVELDTQVGDFGFATFEEAREAAQKRIIAWEDVQYVPEFDDSHSDCEEIN